MKKLLKKITAKFVDTQDKPYLIIGLGNPGREYQNNRHNVGFMVVGEIAKKLGVEFSRVQSNALVTKGEYRGSRIILAKPRTFMNNSGQAAGALARFYKVPQAQILIVYDEVDLDYEVIRLRPEGGSAGHNGMKSIFKTFGTEEFPRLRVGVGRPPGKMPTPAYVLQDFSKQQKETLPFLLDKASDASLKFVSDGITSAMNEFNQKDI